MASQGEASAAAARSRPGPARRRVAAAFAILGGGAALCAGMLAGLAIAFVQLSWTHAAPRGDPEFGINFSCNQAEYLLLEDPALGESGYVPDDRPGRAAWCADTLGALLDATGARHVRLSVEWAQVEPADGEYDFELIDALLEAAGARGTTVLLSVGLKAQRHPEYYLPAWVLARVSTPGGADPSDDPFVRERALGMIGDVVRHAAASPAIDAWLADNEPYHRSPRANEWSLSREFVREEVAAIRAADPRRRPVAINHAERLSFDRRWRWTVEDADIAATSIYPQRIFEVAGLEFTVDILDIGPLMPNYPARARAAREAGKDFWLTEMQAEPWANPDIRLVSPDDPAVDLTIGRLRENIEYARRSGASRVYLWGAEWWLYQREKAGDGRWLAIAAETLRRP